MFQVFVLAISPQKITGMQVYMSFEKVPFSDSFSNNKFSGWSVPKAFGENGENKINVYQNFEIQYNLY